MIFQVGRGLLRIGYTCRQVFFPMVLEYFNPGCFSQTRSKPTETVFKDCNRSENKIPFGPLIGLLIQYPSHEKTS